MFVVPSLSLQCESGMAGLAEKCMSSGFILPRKPYLWQKGKDFINALISLTKVKITLF